MSTAAFFCMGLTISCVHLFEDLDVQGLDLIHHQLLEPAVLGLQLPQAPGLADLQPAIRVAPAVIGPFANLMGSACVADLQPTALDLPKDPEDLLYTRRFFMRSTGFTPQNSHSTLSSFSGRDHHPRGKDSAALCKRSPVKCVPIFSFFRGSQEGVGIPSIFLASPMMRRRTGQRNRASNPDAAR